VKNSSLQALLLVPILYAGFSAPDVRAQVLGSDESTYSRTTVIQSRHEPDSAGRHSGQSVILSLSAEGFSPKYKERMRNYIGQIQMGLDKGWLTAAQADHFRSEIERLRRLDAQVASQNYAQPGLDNLERQMTQFNIDLAAAAAQPAKQQVQSKDTGKAVDKGDKAITKGSE
jgi:hypothetical protein